MLKKLINAQTLTQIIEIYKIGFTFCRYREPMHGEKYSEKFLILVKFMLFACKRSNSEICVNVCKTKSKKKKIDYI